MRATNRKTRAFTSISPVSTPAISMRTSNNKKIIKHSKPGISQAVEFLGKSIITQEITE